MAKIPASGRLGHIGEWNLYVETAFRDFCDLYGWTYQKAGVNDGAYGVVEQVNLIKQAIRAKPDAMVVTMTDAALEPALQEIEAAGITLILNNSCIEDIRRAHNWGFVGAPPYQQGLTCGRMLAEKAIAKGRTDGLIVYGIPIPGHSQLEERGRGVADGVKAVNDEHKSTFTVEHFADLSHDLAQSIPLYNAKRSSAGAQLVAFAASGYTSQLAAFQSLQQAGVPAGAILIGGMDATPDVLEGIRAGYISFAIEQELYHQGFMAAAAVWARIERGATQPIVDTSSAVVTLENVGRFADRVDIIMKRAAELGLRH